VPGLCDYTVFVDRQAKVFLGGPPLVKMATGEDADDEELGGARMHAQVSGLADYFATDERDAIRLGRRIVSELNWRKLGPPPSLPADEPAHDPEELLGIAPADVRVPFDPREVLARVADGSRFGEYKESYGTSLVTGWASVHGYPVGVLANARGVLFSEESKKAAEFILLANQTDTPLLFLQNTTGYMVGTSYEQGGIIKDGAKMINAVTGSTVPHITLNMAASFGAGNYGMCGRAYDPRLLFAWPGSKLAVMGAAQLAGVMSIVGRAAAQASGRPFDEAADEQRRQAIETQIERESHAFFVTARLYDDRLIDPRDTRTVLGIALSAALRPGRGRRGYGVFRMATAVPAIERSCWSPPGARARCGSCAPPTNWTSRPWRCSAIPTPVRRSWPPPTRRSPCPAPSPQRRTCAGTRSSLPPTPPVRRRCTRGTGSWRRTPPSPATARAPASSSSARRRRRSRRWAPRSGPSS
jgi:acetyl-CoA carboxylase carboxyltransferase component